jgi:hypothetical protein
MYLKKTKLFIYYINNSDLFCYFISASPVPPSSIPIQQSHSLNQLSQNTNPYRDIIDNNILYKKLLDIKFEITTNKAIVSAIPNSRPIFYPQSPTQIIPQQQGNIPHIWNTPTNSIWKTNQS